MVIIFILLGLGFLGGGIALVVEGWPYMVLERGFTQVIAGTVLASAGVVLLALSRVLSELGRVRSTLSNALMAASLASMTTRDEPALSEAFALEPAPRRDLADPLPAPAGPALGGVAVGTLAGAAVARTGTSERAAGDDKPGDTDLFGEVTPPERPTAALGEPVGPAPEPEPASASDQIAFDDTAWLERELAAEIAEPPRRDDDTAMPTVPEPPAGDGDPVSGEREAVPLPDGEPRGAAEASEFDFLRESLAQLRAEQDEPAQPRAADGDMRAAAAWMSPSRQERPAEPDAAAAAVPGVAGPSARDVWEAPPWPPLTQGFVVEPKPAAPIETTVEPVPEPVAPIASDAKTEAGTPPALDAADDDDVAVTSEPAASDEGVIGAYQVGEAHFTIYADGSIQARTPDGDYRFGSMDELKVYLASEKSRLGM